MPPNIYVLAADNPQALMSLLWEHPALATSQDEHGYSLVHAAASYNHLELLRALIRDFHVPVDLRDEDGETALFVVETDDAARVLVEELGLDVSIRNDEGLTAHQKIANEGDSPAVAEYLGRVQSGLPTSFALTNGVPNGDIAPALQLPPVPEGLQVTVGTMNEPEEQDQERDPGFLARVEQLAAREDFQTEAGQEELRRLVEEVIGTPGLHDDRQVRPRED